MHESFFKKKTGEKISSHVYESLSRDTSKNRDQIKENRKKNKNKDEKKLEIN